MNRRSRVRFGWRNDQNATTVQATGLLPSTPVFPLGLACAAMALNTLKITTKDGSLGCSSIRAKGDLDSLECSAITVAVALYTG